MQTPKNPLEAVTCPDPYPYYAELVQEQPLYFDRNLGWWIASGAREIEAILGHEACRVRPIEEPVPVSIVGLKSGEIFGGLVRMNDGAEHIQRKRAVSEAISPIDFHQLNERSREWARFLCAEIDIHRELDQYIFQLPVYVMADLLGLPKKLIPQVSQWAGDFVRGITPGANLEQIGQGDAAASQLIDVLEAMSLESEENRNGGLFRSLTNTMASAGVERNSVIFANAIGMLSQAYEATAGLIGNTLVALAEEEVVRSQIADDEMLLRSVVMEVVRYDAPIQNTRRYLSEEIAIDDRKMKQGQGILLVLAAANRDPRVNPEPHRFEPLRKQRRSFTFGYGNHACPGETLALSIAAAGVRELRAFGFDFERARRPRVYRPSINARIPTFKDPLSNP